MKRAGLFFGAFLVILAFLSGCKETEIEEVKISLNKSVLNLSKGQTEQLTPTITPSSAKVDLEWSSADKAVAKVSNDGDVTGVAAGETVVTVRAGEASATCNVIVNPTAVEEVKLDKETAEMIIGEKLTLKATVLPADADDAVLTWKSLNAEVASVDSKGEVLALKDGSATIVATAGGKSAQCVITVNKPFVHVESVKITKSVAKIVEGESFAFDAAVTPEDATDKSLSWESSNPDVLSVSADGNAVAKAPGKVEVTVRSVDGGKTDKCTVEVEAAYVAVEKVELLGVTAPVEMIKGDVKTFEAKVSPEKATDKTVVWSVSDDKVLSVDQNGKVTAIGGGKANVVVTAKDGGKKAECEVVVTVPVTGITLNKTTMELTEGDDVVLTATVLPEDATNKNVSWTSSDETVATVKDGKVTALKPGTVKITVKTEDGGKTAECQVTVVAKVYPVTGVTLDKTSAELTEGDELVLAATVSPANATNKNVTWISSDETVATVKDGKVTALKPGTVKITVKTSDGGKTAECQVTVVAKVYPVTGVTLDKTSAELTEGDELVLAATVSPANATNKNVTWISSDETVATVKDGKVTALKPGTAKITVKTEDGGKTAECTVQVKSKIIKVESVEITSAPQDNTMTINDEFTFAVSVRPENATDKSVTWTSSNKSVLSVDADGKVKALAEGTSEITVKTTDGGFTDKCTVTVKKPVVKVTAVEIISKPASNRMVLGDSFTFVAKVSPDNATDKTVKWTSKNTNVLSINASTGEATTNNTGTATVVAECDSKKAEVTISVVVPSGKVTGINLSIDKGVDYVRHGKTIQINADYSPSGAYPADGKWFSSNPELATVDANGLVKAVSFDYTQLHSYYRDNGYPEVSITHQADYASASIKLKILPAVPEKIVVSNPPPAQLKLGQYWDMGEISILPVEAEQRVTIICNYDGEYGGQIGSNFAPTQIGNMNVHIVAMGEHAQAVQTGTNVDYYIEVLPEKETSITLNKTSYTANVGSVFVLTHEIQPLNATYKDVTWTSSAPSVATVSDGVVRALSSGSATITARTHHGVTATCQVTVSGKSSVAVGDYYYSDGTTSSEMIAGKTPVAVVFALADATVSDPGQLGKDYPGCTHGLAVSIKEYESALSMVNASEEGWVAVAQFAKNKGNYMDMANGKLAGYSNTKAMKDYKASTGNYSAYLNALSGHDVNVAGASSWFMPSLYELSLIAENYSLLNEKLAAVGDKFEDYANSWSSELRSGIYWSSTYLEGMKTQSKPYVLSLNKLDDTMKYHSHVYQVRFIFAF